MSSERKYFMHGIKALMVLFVIILLGTSVGFAQSEEDAYRVEEFGVSDNVSLEVQTSGGSINVIGSKENEVVVEMYVRRKGNYISPGDADLDEYDITISQDGNVIKAFAERKSNRSWNWNDRDNYSVSFVVYTPNVTRTRLKTSGGSLSVKNLAGSQELKTSGGSINAEGIQGEMILKTSGGSISINDVQGNVEAKTSGGTIRAESILGNLDAKTSGGSIRLSGLEGNVKAKTSGGSINAEILSPSEYIDLKTSGGSIKITVPEENGYDLDLDGNRVYAQLKNFSGEAEKDEIRGTYNGGGTTIEAKTSGGSVRLEYL